MEAKIQAAGAIKQPPNPIVGSNDFTTFCGTNGLAMDEKTGNTWAVVFAAAIMCEDSGIAYFDWDPNAPNDWSYGFSIPRNNDVNGNPQNPARVGVGGLYVDPWPGDAVGGGMDEKTARSILKSFENDVAYYVAVGLTACFQVKSLDDRNLDSLGNATNVKLNNGLIKRFFTFFATWHPFIPSNNTMNALVQKNPFFLYHTSAATSGQLLKKVFDDLPADFQAFFPGADVQAADIAIAARWNPNAHRVISAKGLAITMAYIEATGMNINRWYMGERARDNYAPSKYRGMVNAFKKLAALAQNKDAVDAAENANQLAHAAAVAFA
jgi:hypothetical protein